MSCNTDVETPVRPTLGTIKCESVENSSSARRKTGKRFGAPLSAEKSSDQERRVAQRKKQISYGYMTEGYHNMIKLVEHDPLLKSGGILPLSPPDVTKGSKRNWDISLRKWRRALHMFDNIYIDGDTDSKETLEDVIEKQRLQWISPLFIDEAKNKRLLLTSEKIREARKSPYVPKKLPVEESLKIILRGEECYEPVCNVVPPSASSLIKGSDISHLDAGIKIYLTPSTYNKQTANHESPENTLQWLLPQHLDFDISTPARNEDLRASIQVISPHDIPSQSGIAYDMSLRTEPSCLHRDLTLSSLRLNTYHQPHAHATNISQPLFWKERGNFAGLTNTTFISDASSTMHLGLGQTRTPATAPRRVTLLRGTQGARKIGDVMELKNTLYSESKTTSSFTDSKVNNVCLHSPTDRFVELVTKDMEHGKHEFVPIDNVSQKLF